VKVLKCYIILLSPQELSHFGIKLLVTFLRFPFLSYCFSYVAMLVSFSLHLIFDLLLQLADNSNTHLKNMALDALDQCISAVLGSDRFQDYKLSKSLESSQEVRLSTIFMPGIHNLLKEDLMCVYNMQMEVNLDKLRSLECSVISPLKVLYFSTQSVDVRVGSLKILLHVLEVMLLLIGQVSLSFLFPHCLFT